MIEVDHFQSVEGKIVDHPNEVFISESSSEIGQIQFRPKPLIGVERR